MARQQGDKVMETNQELLARYHRIKAMVDKRSKQKKRSDDAARFLGSLNFLLLQIKSELDERKIKYD